jgi:hypothetical protein
MDYHLQQVYILFMGIEITCHTDIKMPWPCFSAQSCFSALVPSWIDVCMCKLFRLLSIMHAWQSCVTAHTFFHWRHSFDYDWTEIWICLYFPKRNIQCDAIPNFSLNGTERTAIFQVLSASHIHDCFGSLRVDCSHSNLELLHCDHPWVLKVLALSWIYFWVDKVWHPRQSPGSVEIKE